MLKTINFISFIYIIFTYAYIVKYTHIYSILLEFLTNMKRTEKQIESIRIILKIFVIHR